MTPQETISPESVTFSISTSRPSALTAVRVAASEHLRILREAGLIQGEIEGPRTRYCTNATGLAVLKAGIAAL